MAEKVKRPFYLTRELDKYFDAGYKVIRCTTEKIRGEIGIRVEMVPPSGNTTKMVIANA